jgi:hypothetical protein
VFFFCIPSPCDGEERVKKDRTQRYLYYIDLIESLNKLFSETDIALFFSLKYRACGSCGDLWS